MSDTMFYGVLRMPYIMAMSDEISRLQFYSRVQECADRCEAAEALVASQTKTFESLESENTVLRAQVEDLQARLAQSAAPVAASGDLSVVHKFLLGEGPLDGFYFGDTARPRPVYWWRNNLRAALAAPRQHEKAAQSNCETCSGHGLIGGLMPGDGGYHSEDCPDCDGRGYVHGEVEYDGDGYLQPPDPPTQSKCEVCDGSGKVNPADAIVQAQPHSKAPSSAYGYPGWTRCCDKQPENEGLYEIKLCALRNAEITKALFRDGKWWTTDGAMSLDGVPPVGNFDFGWREAAPAQPIAGELPPYPIGHMRWSSEEEKAIHTYGHQRRAAALNLAANRLQSLSDDSISDAAALYFAEAAKVVRALNKMEG